MGRLLQSHPLSSKGVSLLNHVLLWQGESHLNLNASWTLMSKWHSSAILHHPNTIPPLQRASPKSMHPKIEMMLRVQLNSSNVSKQCLEMFVLVSMVWFDHLHCVYWVSVYAMDYHQPRWDIFSSVTLHYLCQHSLIIPFRTSQVPLTMWLQKRSLLVWTSAPT